MMAILAMGPMAVGVAQADNGVPAADASSQTVSTPVTDAGVDCSAVTDWTMLSQCLSATKTGGLVTITTTVTVPDGAQTAISTPITLTATTGAATSIETTTPGDTFFVVEKGGSLTIGKDTTDNGFSYKNGKRYFAYVEKGGSLTVNNGTFSGIDVTGNGSVAYNAGGTVTINNGMFSGNKALNGGVISQADGATTIMGGTFSDNTAANNGGALYAIGTLNVQGESRSPATARREVTSSGTAAAPSGRRASCT
nr:hypothetical protein [Bifidobacterium sp. UTBIF-68]